LMATLWRWSVPKDEWELITQAADANKQTVLRGYKRRDRKGIRFKWTAEQVPPRKFRTRTKKGE
jgi:hypothetical protein